MPRHAIFTDDEVAELLAEEHGARIAGMKLGDKDAIEVTRQWVIAQYRKAKAQELVALRTGGWAAYRGAELVTADWLRFQSFYKIKAITRLAQRIADDASISKGLMSKQDQL